MFPLFPAARGESKEWHVQLGCREDFIASSTVSCWNMEKLCCHLQDVLNNIQEGDTIYLSQASAKNALKCNRTGEIQIWVRNSFILKTLQPKTLADLDSLEGIHGMQVVFSNNCSGHCSLKISHSHFSCSLVTINDLDIWIKDTRFKDSSLSVV